MKQFSERDDSLSGVILRVVDSAVTVGIMALVIGIVLLTLFPPGSFGATAPLDPETPASVATTVQQVYGPELPTRESGRRESFNLNLGKKEAPRVQFRLEQLAGNGARGSEHVTRTDETSVRLVAPWQ